MTLRSVPAGSIIERVYYSVPDQYTIGDTFDTFTEAAKAAQTKRAALVAALTESLGDYSTPAQIERFADTNVVLDLRWEIREASGTLGDLVIERFNNVAQFRVT